jgi:hypothetical protein
MTIRDALRRGSGRLWRHKRIAIAFYGATTIEALLIAAPAMAFVFYTLGDSAWARQMAGNLDIAWFSEIAAAYGYMPMWPAATLLVGMGAISLAVYLFLLGGAIGLLSGAESFFASSARYFGRMLRLALVAAVLYALVLVAYNRLGAIGRGIWGAGSEATPLMYWGWFCAAAALLLAGVVDLLFNYGGICLVADDRRSALRAVAAAFRVVRAHPRRTAGLYAAVWAIAGVLFAAYLAVSHTVAPSSLALVIVLLLARQGMVLAKIWSRLLFYSTAGEMYAALRPQAEARGGVLASPPEPEAPPPAPDAADSPASSQPDQVAG